MIWKNDNFMILLMSWRPDDFTSIHNHGRTEWSSVHFFGDATHRLYDFNNGQLNIAESSEFIEGQNASVCGDLTHLMGLNMCTTLSLGEDRFSDISPETLTDYLQLSVLLYGIPFNLQDGRCVLHLGSSLLF